MDYYYSNNDDVGGGGWQGAPYFSRYGRALVSKPAILFKKSWGGHRRTTQSLQDLHPPHKKASSESDDPPPTAALVARNSRRRAFVGRPCVVAWLAVAIFVGTPPQKYVMQLLSSTLRGAFMAVKRTLSCRQLEKMTFFVCLFLRLFDPAAVKIGGLPPRSLRKKGRMHTTIIEVDFIFIFC